MNRERYLRQIDRVIQQGPYKAQWESIASCPLPPWYREKRLGIFLHWGPFSVPAYHDWYARNMYIQSNVIFSTSQGLPHRGIPQGFPAPAEITSRPSTMPLVYFGKKCCPGAYNP